MVNGLHEKERVLAGVLSCFKPADVALIGPAVSAGTGRRKPKQARPLLHMVLTIRPSSHICTGFLPVLWLPQPKIYSQSSADPGSSPQGAVNWN